MIEENLNKVKEFESILKEYLLKEFGTFLPDNKVSILNATNYFEKNDFTGIKTVEEMQGKLLTDMLNDVIGVSCYKNLQVEEGVVIPLPYGVSLQEALVNYYANEISNKYGFNIGEIPSLKEDIQTVEELMKRLNEKEFEELITNKDAIELFKDASFDDLVKKYDNEALKKYFEDLSIIHAGDAEVTNQLLTENQDRKDSLQVVDIDDKLNVKYVDKEGKTHLTEIEDSENAERLIQEAILTQSEDKPLDTEKLYDEINGYVHETTLKTTEEVDKHRDTLNHEEVNMLDFVKANKKINDLAEEDVITHSEDGTIHVIEKTDGIVTTESHADHVESTLIDSGSSLGEEDTTQKNMDNDERILSPEEYEELCQRFANNEELTLEELRLLKNSSVEMMEEKGTVLRPKNNTSGYADYSFTFYLVVLFAIICIVISTYILFNVS